MRTVQLFLVCAAHPTEKSAVLNANANEYFDDPRNGGILYYSGTGKLLLSPAKAGGLPKGNYSLAAVVTSQAGRALARASRLSLELSFIPLLPGRKEEKPEEARLLLLFAV